MSDQICRCQLRKHSHPSGPSPFDRLSHTTHDRGGIPSQPANDDGSRMTRQPVQDTTLPGSGRRPHTHMHSTHTHRHSSSAPEAQQQAQSMDAHRLSKCLFLHPRATADWGRSKGLSDPHQVRGFEMPGFLSASLPVKTGSQVSQSVSQSHERPSTAAVRTQCRGMVCTPSTPNTGRSR